MIVTMFLLIIKISRASALSVDVILIFDMYDLNGALFLEATFSSV